MHDLAKEAWLKALRSGEYEQTTGQLAHAKDKNGKPSYCCLGVLCEVAIRNGANVEKSSNDGYNFRYDKTLDILPESVRQWAGLEEREPLVTYHGERSMPLTVLNDDYELNFEEIADIVEESL